MNVGENSHPGILKMQKNPGWGKKKKKEGKHFGN